ncbi:MAG: hypothetical protein EOL87_18625 [Spartobacteria bacterium]|nr:hypothetical protein [Spartobacteria bacterium]
MRNVFMVFAKLIGLLQLYWGISYIAALSLTFRHMQNSQLPTDISQGSAGMQVLPIMGFALLTFGIAYLLMFCTDGLARMLGIKDNQDSDKLPIILTLQAGVKLIGVYLVALAIPEIFKSLSEWIFTIRQYSSGTGDDPLYAQMFRTAAAQGFFSSIIPSILKLALGLFVAVRTSTVIRLITQDQKAE